MCLEVRAVRGLLSNVTALRDLNVGPLYNVWDYHLDPPIDLTSSSMTSQLPWLTLDRVNKGRVKVPWRGG